VPLWVSFRARRDRRELAGGAKRQTVNLWPVKPPIAEHRAGNAWLTLPLPEAHPLASRQIVVMPLVSNMIVADSGVTQ
jgi:hypothetical protein